MEDLTGVKAESILGTGNFEYAKVFYGQRRPIMIDLVGNWDDGTAAKYQSLRKVGNILISESKESHRPFGDRYFKNTAGPLYDEKGNAIGAIEKRTVLKEPKIPSPVQGESCFEDLTIFPLVANGVEGPVRFLFHHHREPWRYHGCVHGKCRRNALCRSSAQSGQLMSTAPDNFFRKMEIGLHETCTDSGH